MKKLSLGAALVSALILSSGAQAQTVGARGVINFTGEINNDSCIVSGPENVSRGVFNVDMGSISSLQLGTEAAPHVQTGILPVVEVPVDLTLTCATGTKIQLALTPQVASGRGIGTTGNSTGAQITLMRGGAVVDLSTAAGRTIAADLGPGNKVELGLTAYYTTKAGPTPPPVTPGSANATLNYVLSYE